MIGRFTNEKKIDAERAIRTLAMKEGKTVEYIRSQMKLAMISGLCNPDPQVQANWKRYLAKEKPRPPKN